MINLDDGLDFDEVLQIARALRVTRLLKPELHQQLLDGTNSLLSITTSLQAIPWLLGLIPGNIGAQLDGGVRALKLVKALLEA